jgi:hypothetical protein
MEFHELHRNSQSKTSSTMLPGAAGINLTESLEEILSLSISETLASVYNLEPDHSLVIS